MKNDFCNLNEKQLSELEIPPLAVGLLTSPFQYNERNGWIMVPADTFKKFTDCVTEYVKLHNIANEKSPDAGATE